MIKKRDGKPFLSDAAHLLAHANEPDDGLRHKADGSNCKPELADVLGDGSQLDLRGRRGSLNARDREHNAPSTNNLQGRVRTIRV